MKTPSVDPHLIIEIFWDIPEIAESVQNKCDESMTVNIEHWNIGHIDWMHVSNKVKCQTFYAWLNQVCRTYLRWWVVSFAPTWIESKTMTDIDMLSHFSLVMSVEAKKKFNQIYENHRMIQIYLFSCNAHKIVICFLIRTTRYVIFVL